MDAVLLAGGSIPEELRAATGATERALIEVGGVPIIESIVDSLRQVPVIERIVVVSTPGALERLNGKVIGVPSGDRMVANLLAGANAAQSEEILIVTGDVPLVSAATWQEFIDGAARQRLEAAYPVVRRQTVEQQFPGGKRTYGNLKDGAFTGGNAFLFPRKRLPALETLIDTAYSARKNPFRLARMLGLGFIMKAVTKKLAIADVEKKMTSILGCRAGAVIMEDATIAFDVDKVSDLEAANQHLSAR
jgi:CTP:molybdopterin cytidylyltransferase MocA